MQNVECAVHIGDYSTARKQNIVIIEDNDY